MGSGCPLRPRRAQCVSSGVSVRGHRGATHCQWQAQAQAGSGCAPQRLSLRLWNPPALPRRRRHNLRGLCWQLLQVCPSHRHQRSLFGVPMQACLRGSRLEPSTNLASACVCVNLPLNYSKKTDPGPTSSWSALLVRIMRRRLMSASLSVSVCDLTKYTGCRMC